MLLQLLFRVFICVSVLVAVATLSSCGSGGSTVPLPVDSPPGSSPPYIRANVLSFNPDSDQGNIPNVSVEVSDGNTGVDITDAVVTVNERQILYNAAPGHEAYEGNLFVAPGESIVLRVTVGTSSYLTTSTQFTNYPTISAPAVTTWYNALPHTVKWTAAAPTTDAIYNIGILDAANPYDVVVWPADGEFMQVGVGATGQHLARQNLSTGSRLIFMAIVKGTAIPGAAGGSGLIVAGCSTRPITIVDTALTSLAVSPADATLPWGSTQQYRATAFFADSTSIDVTEDVQWGSEGFSLSMGVYGTPGLASASWAGQGTVKAFLDNDITASTSVTVLAPRLQSIQITPGSRTIVPDTVQHFTAVGHFEDNSDRDITSLVTWSSSNDQVASISNNASSNGECSAFAAGTITLSASMQGVSQTAVLTVAPRPTFASSYVYLQSDSGDYVGNGVTTSFTSAESQTFSFSVDQGHLAIRIVKDLQTTQFAIGDFMLPGSLSAYQVGYFGNVTRYPFNDPAVGGLNWDMNSRGCNRLTGWFAVDNVTYTSGQLSAIDLRFVQHCEDRPSALYGWLHLE